MTSSLLNPLTTTRPLRDLFVASIGNPAPYTNTLHSAGHHVLRSLQQYFSYEEFKPDRSTNRASTALISVGNEYYLWQCPSSMNVSGPHVAQAWYTWVRKLPHGERQRRARLVIIHDELEAALGYVKTRDCNASLKGHNGLKSIAATNAGSGVGGGGTKFWRIGVGIGRPISRTKGDVSDYVLSDMTGKQKEKIYGAVELVAQELEKLRQ